MKRAVIIVICGLIVLACAGWGAYKWYGGTEQVEQQTQVDNTAKSDTDNASKANDENAELEKLQEQRDKIKGTITEEDLAAFKEKGLNPFGEKIMQEDLTDSRYEEYIHGMSHQKVKAEKKWGFYEIHPARIQWLLDGLDKVNLDHENVYRGILEKWNKGDFSNADDDHNAIWNLQGGTVGKATGVLNAQEEQVYVEKNAE